MTDEEALRGMKSPARWLGFGAGAAFLAMLIGGLPGAGFAGIGFVGIWLAARAGVKDRPLTIVAAVVFIVSVAGGFVASDALMKAQQRAQERQLDRELQDIAQDALRNVADDPELQKALRGYADGGAP